MNDADAEFHELFKTEAAERLDTMAGLLLDVEQGSGDVDTVPALLREAHTLKGAAGMVGLAEVSELAHELETMLVPVRDAGAPLPAELVEPLLAGVDELRRLAHGRSPDRARPATSPRIRVRADRVDRLLELVGETVLHRRRLGHRLAPDAADELTDELHAGDLLLDELKSTAIGMRMQEIATIAAPLRRAVREAARTADKNVELIVTGGKTEIDRAILEELVDPLVHLLRNAVAHGVETSSERADAGKPSVGRVELRAAQRAGLVEIAVVDDGRGVPASLLGEPGDGAALADRLATPGFSSATEVTALAGRGVGLDAVKRFAESHGGTLAVHSVPGRGTEVTLALPFTLALVAVLLFERGLHVFGLPLANVDEVVQVRTSIGLGGRPRFELRGEVIPLADIADLIGADAPAALTRPPAIVVGAAGRRVVATCDRLLGEEDVVMNGFEPPLSSVRGYLGTALLGDGRIALVLDPAELVRAPVRRVDRPVTTPGETPKRRVLVVEDSFTVRELQRSILEAAGYDVTTAEDGRRALQRLANDDSIGLVVSDVEMPAMDGLEMTVAIRADKAHASLPVVIVTSHATDDDRRRGLAAGADAYIAKNTFEQGALLATVERLIGR